MGMNPENKGWAIGNTPELACAHNSHAIPQARKKTDKNAGVSTGRFTGEIMLPLCFSDKIRWDINQNSSNFQGKPTTL